MKVRWYCGIRKNGKREIFSTDYTPTPDDYPQYVAVIGPHRSKRGAAFSAHCGENNPHVQTAADADRLAARLRYTQQPSGTWICLR